MVHVGCTPSFGQYRMYVILKPLALDCVNPIPISMSWYTYTYDPVFFPPFFELEQLAKTFCQLPDSI